MYHLLPEQEAVIRKAAGKFSIPGYDHDDLIQEGALTLLQLQNRYDEITPSLLFRAVRNNLITLLHRVTQYDRRQKEARGSTININEIDSKLIVSRDTALAVELSPYANLPLTQRRVLLMRMAGYNMAEIGRVVGITEGRVSQILKGVMP